METIQSGKTQFEENGEKERSQADFHQKMYNFYQTLAQHNRGTFGLFGPHPISGNSVGGVVPDYSICFGLYTTREKADNARLKRLYKSLSGPCLIVVPV